MCSSYRVCIVYTVAVCVHHIYSIRRGIINYVNAIYVFFGYSGERERERVHFQGKKNCVTRRFFRRFCIIYIVTVYVHIYIQSYSHGTNYVNAIYFIFSQEDEEDEDF